MTAVQEAGLTKARRAWVIAVGRRYWPREHACALVEATAAALPRAGAEGKGGPLTRVALPAWAADLGVESTLLVEQACIVAGEGPDWQRCDWITAAFAHLTGAAERRHEGAVGPAHSYSFRLSGIDQRLFDHAWANRILLLLRRLAAQNTGLTESAILANCRRPRSF